MAVIGTPENVLAMLSSASQVRCLSPVRWPYDRALQLVRDNASLTGSLGRAARNWEFAPSLDGGVALVGLKGRLRVLAQRGWLRRDWDAHVYVVQPDMFAAGSALLGALERDDRRLVYQIARRWSAWLSTSPKNSR